MYEEKIKVEFVAIRAKIWLLQNLTEQWIDSHK